MTLAELQGGDFQIEEFLERMRPRLRGTLAHFQIPPQDAEDLVQQALLALVYKWDEIRGPESWLLGTLRHKCLLYWRSRRRSLYQAVDTVGLELFADSSKLSQERREMVVDLNGLAARIPEHCRTLLRLRYGLGYDPPEVAEKMGYQQSSISKVTQRCLAALNRALISRGTQGKAGQSSAARGPRS